MHVVSVCTQREDASFFSLCQAVVQQVEIDAAVSDGRQCSF